MSFFSATMYNYMETNSDNDGVSELALHPFPTRKRETPLSQEDGFSSKDSGVCKLLSATSSRKKNSAYNKQGDTAPRNEGDTAPRREGGTTQRKHGTAAQRNHSCAALRNRAAEKLQLAQAAAQDSKTTK